MVVWDEFYRPAALFWVLNGRGPQKVNIVTGEKGDGRGSNAEHLPVDYIRDYIRDYIMDYIISALTLFVYYVFVLRFHLSPGAE